MSAASTGPVLAHVSAEDFAGWLDAAVDVYLRALGRPAALAQSRRLSMAQHLREPGVRAVIVCDAGQLVGFGYGYHDRPGQWWHDVVAEVLPRAVSRRWLDDAFQVTELHVLPSHQGRGLGAQLLRELLVEVPHQTAVLTAYDEPTPARALYRKAGFTELAGGLRFPGNDEVYVVMGADLPLQLG